MNHTMWLSFDCFAYIFAFEMLKKMFKKLLSCQKDQQIARDQKTSRVVRQKYISTD